MPSGGRTDGRTDLTKIMVAFRNSAKASNKSYCCVNKLYAVHMDSLCNRLKPYIAVQFATLDLCKEWDDHFRQHKVLELHQSAREIWCLDLSIFATQQKTAFVARHKGSRHTLNLDETRKHILIMHRQA